jgi:hypothetical protein
MLISLGFSCQTRFMIEALHPDLKRQPFDFNITSRAALIRALETDGASLVHQPETMATYLMPIERRQGVEVSGMFFWHDYPLNDDKLTLHPDWPLKHEQVNAKYAMLWQRFSELVRSETEKTLVLSNSQHNLPQFAEDEADFSRKFGLGRIAHEELVAALDGYGARSYRLKFLSRTVDEMAETAHLHGERLDHRFVGALSLRVAPDMVAKLFSGRDEPGIADLAGSYEDGDKLVRPISARTALIFDRGDEQPQGSLSRIEGGLLAAFPGRNTLSMVTLERDTLVFSNGMRWARTPTSPERSNV